MKLSEIMNPNPLTVQVGADLHDAHSKMVWGNVRELPVLDNDRVVGILSEHDVLSFLTGPQDIGRSIPVVDMAMSKPVQTAAPNDSLTEAAARMATSKLGCLPVTERGHLVGLVTTADVLRAEVETSLLPGKSPLTAGDVMAKVAITVSPRDLLLDAAAHMQRSAVVQAPVVDAERKTVGVLTNYDVRAALGDPTEPREEGKWPRGGDLRVEDVMSGRGITVKASTPVHEIARLFYDHRLLGVPVVDDREELLGLISYLDLVRSTL